MSAASQRQFLRHVTPRRVLQRNGNGCAGTAANPATYDEPVSPGFRPSNLRFPKRNLLTRCHLALAPGSPAATRDRGLRTSLIPDTTVTDVENARLQTLAEATPHGNGDRNCWSRPLGHGRRR